MLKQFNPAQQTFADPILRDDRYHTSGEGWFAIETQAEINGISASITGGGEVWVEEGKLRYSGKKPSDLHHWDSQDKRWKTLTAEQQQAKLAAELEAVRTGLISEVAAKTDRLKDAILAGYPQAEIESFYRQEREARGWTADNQTPTPMLTAIAENRGVPFEILVQKVIEKADQVAVIIGQIIGQRQAFEDRILQAKTLEDLTALKQEIHQWQPLNH